MQPHGGGTPSLLREKTQLINELESLAVSLSFIVARDLLRERHVMCCLDNDAARETLPDTPSLLSNASVLLGGEAGMITPSLAEFGSSASGGE